ncbi:MAG TPA: class I SAM-dependent methyltransferase, partial [Nitrososphaerales archaeon]|nr:class I SAM-dependent methyltransferase [Nitrososphaerales archaeon]
MKVLERPATGGESFNSTSGAGRWAFVKLVEHIEGRTRLVVPKVSLEEDPPPTSPVFFNPAASLNRDISVCMAEAAGAANFCDSMAGVGARGVRIAKEAARTGKVTMVDFNGEALELAKKAAALNGVAGKCEFAHSETSAYLYSRYGRET